MPLIVVAGLLFGGAGSHGSSAKPSGAALAPITVAAPVSTSPATITTCAQVISTMPLVLDGQNIRRTVSNPPSPSIVAWGNPAIVLRCGVARPKSLHPPATALYVSATGQGGPYYDVTTSHGASVWTTVDRAIYLELTVPAKYNSGPLPIVSTEIAKTLPAVCAGGQPPSGAQVPTSTLCAFRK